MVSFKVDDPKTFILKVLTVIVGVVDVGLVGENYSPVFTEKPFLSVVCIAFSISLILLVLQTCNVMTDSALNKRIVIAYHCITALLLFMTASVFFFSVIGLSCTGTGCSPLMTKRYFAAALGFINGFLYGFVAWNLMEIKIVSKSTSNPGTGEITVRT